MTDQNMKINFKTLLLSVGNSLDKEEDILDDIKYMVEHEMDNGVTKEELHSIDSGKEMLKMLSRKNILNEHNLEWLKTLLTEAKKHPEAKKIEDFIIKYDLHTGDKQNEHKQQQQQVKKKESYSESKKSTTQSRIYDQSRPWVSPIPAAVPPKVNPESILSVSSASDSINSLPNEAISHANDESPESFQPESFQGLKGPYSLKQLEMLKQHSRTSNTKCNNIINYPPMKRMEYPQVNESDESNNATAHLIQNVISEAEPEPKKLNTIPKIEKNTTPVKHDVKTKMDIPLLVTEEKVSTHASFDSWKSKPSNPWGDLPLFVQDQEVSSPHESDISNKICTNEIKQIWNDGRIPTVVDSQVVSSPFATNSCNISSHTSKQNKDGKIQGISKENCYSFSSNKLPRDLFQDENLSQKTSRKTKACKDWDKDDKSNLSGFNPDPANSYEQPDKEPLSLYDFGISMDSLQ